MKGCRGRAFRLGNLLRAIMNFREPRRAAFALSPPPPAGFCIEVTRRLRYVRYAIFAERAPAVLHYIRLR